MHDPIGAFTRIRELYLAYLDTAFGIQDEAIAEERRALLRQFGTLCAEPLLEATPLYENAYAIDQLRTPSPADALEGFDGAARAAFVDLCLSGLIESRVAPDGSRRAKNRLYTHQARMLERGVRAGRPGVVTSGTGSGKTESFLLPILASIAREALGWAAPNPGYLGRRWWQGETGTAYPAPRRLPSKAHPERTPFVAHRNGEHSTRPAGVRALILYPMNALVEDQMVRLRRALDSSEVRETMDDHFRGNRIFFGRYTGMTPVTSWDFHPRMANIPVPQGGEDDEEDDVALWRGELARRRRKLTKLFHAMRDIELAQRRAEDIAIAEALSSGRSELQELGQAGKRRASRYELPFMFPSVDGAEMVSRWDMHVHPPDLLITNISMLNAMLAREVDRPIIAKTRSWLESSKDAYFYLVLDELHLHRGAAGTEVASLLRQLVVALGLNRPEHAHKLRVLASSASLPLEGERGIASLEFLWGMYGKFGTQLAGTGDDVAGGPDIWRPAVEPGDPVAERVFPIAQLDPGPFTAFLDANRALQGQTDPSETVRVPQSKSKPSGVQFTPNSCA